MPDEIDEFSMQSWNVLMTVLDLRCLRARSSTQPVRRHGNFLARSDVSWFEVWWGVPVPQNKGGLAPRFPNIACILLMTPNCKPRASVLGWCQEKKIMFKSIKVTYDWLLLHDFKTTLILLSNHEFEVLNPVVCGVAQLLSEILHHDDRSVVRIYVEESEPGRRLNWCDVVFYYTERRWLQRNYDKNVEMSQQIGDVNPESFQKSSRFSSFFNSTCYIQSAVFEIVI